MNGPGLDKSLHVRTNLCRKLVAVQTYFITSKLLYALDSNTAYVMLFIWHLDQNKQKSKFHKVSFNHW